MEDRDRFGQRDRQVEEQRALAGLLDGFDPKLVLAFGGGVRLGGIQVGGFAAAARRPAQRGTVGRLALADEKIVRIALDRVAVIEAEGLRAGAPPAAGWLCPALAGLDVIAGRILGRAAVDLLPDVIQVVSLAQRRDNRH